MSNNNIEAAVGAPTPVIVQGVEIAINKIKMGQLSKVLQLMTPFAESFIKKPAVMEEANYVLLQVFTNHTDNVLQLLELLTGQPKAWIESLDLDDGVFILTKVVEVNLDFFIQKLLPMLIGSLKSSVNGIEKASAGLTASKS